jgi:hypothetical protein
MHWVQPCIQGTAPSPRAGHTAACLTDGQLLVFGGGYLSKVSDALYMFDIADDAAVAAITAGGGGDGVDDKSALKHGDDDEDNNHNHTKTNNNVDGVGVADVFFGRWSRPSDSGTVPTPRACLSSASHGSCVYMFGGGDVSHERVFLVIMSVCVFVCLCVFMHMCLCARLSHTGVTFELTSVFILTTFIPSGQQCVQ